MTDLTTHMQTTIQVMIEQARAERQDKATLWDEAAPATVEAMREAHALACSLLKAIDSGEYGLELISGKYPHEFYKMIAEVMRPAEIRVSRFRKASVEGQPEKQLWYVYEGSTERFLQELECRLGKPSYLTHEELL